MPPHVFQRRTPQTFVIVDNERVEDERQVVAVPAAHRQALAVEAGLRCHRRGKGEKLSDHGGRESDAAGGLVDPCAGPLENPERFLMPNADADFLKQLQGLFVQFFHFGVAECAQDQLAHGVLLALGGTLPAGTLVRQVMILSPRKNQRGETAVAKVGDFPVSIPGDRLF